MTKEEVIHIIDEHKNQLVHPVEMLHWTWIRVIINQIPEKDWQVYVNRATMVLSQG